MKTIRDIFRSYAVFSPDGKHVNGTDKQSNHNYGDAYEELFLKRVSSPPRLYSLRGEVKLMMEIGIAGGASLLAWREVFPNATCVGVDIMPDAAHNHAGEDRLEFCVGDATHWNICDLAANNRQFDFIVEDATHDLGDSLRILVYLWPYVKPGGIYVIEEFDNVLALRRNIETLFQGVEIIDTKGPFGGTEPLVVLRKPH